MDIIDLSIKKFISVKCCNLSLLKLTVENIETLSSYPFSYRAVIAYSYLDLDTKSHE